MPEANGMEPVMIKLTGRIDSNNAPQIGEEINGLLKDNGGAPVVMDASELEYISSAGLRVILRVKQTNPDLKITGVSSGVYEVLEMTGFTEMMQVEKAYRVVSIEGCEEIGRGANGVVYRVDDDNVVKVYFDSGTVTALFSNCSMLRLSPRYLQTSRKEWIGSLASMSRC